MCDASSTDTNNNTTTKYDALGRIENIIGPNEQATGNLTLRFDYHPEGSAGCAAPGASGCAGTVPYALTQHFDVDADGHTKDSGTIDTVLFTDGLKRVIQTKKDASVLEGTTAQPVMIVSGRLMFDEVGLKTAYSYDAKTRRLASLTAQKNDGTLFQNLAYSYDKVGNILALANNVAVPPPNVYGGPTSQSFAYDELYRLTHAQGTFQFSPTKTHTYSMDMGYDTIHNIVSKNQLHTIIQPSTQAVTQKKTTYNFAYTYNPSGVNSIRPHAPNHIDVRSYSYDLDGNQTGWTHDTNGTRRNITWDDENRIQAVFDNGQEKDYKYDDQGQRMIKRGPQGETVYVNQFFTQRPGANGTKHVYAGTTRIASKLVLQGTPNSNPNGATPFEKDIFFYHPDHIGSTNYVTDLNGKLFEHIEYFPFGESWVEENTNQQRTPYLFSAKELDEETGLYYFGA